MKDIVSLAFGPRWKSVVAWSAVCFCVSAVAFVTLWINCTRHNDFRSETECLSRYGWSNPYFTLSLLLFTVLAVASLRRGGFTARRILVWWMALMASFLAWLFLVG